MNASAVLARLLCLALTLPFVSAHAGIREDLRLTEVGVGYRELTNIGTETLDLIEVSINNVAVTQHVYLQPGKSVILVNDAAAYNQAHPPHSSIISPLVYGIAGPNFADLNVPFWLSTQSIGDNFFNFRPDQYPNLLSGTAPFEINDPTGDFAASHSPGAWRNVRRSPGFYHPFTGSDLDSFDQPTLRDVWSPREWKISGNKNAYSLTKSPGFLRLENAYPTATADLQNNSFTRKVPIDGDWALEASFSVENQAFAGISLFTDVYTGGSEQHAFGVYNGNELRLQDSSGTISASETFAGGSVQIRLMRSGTTISCQVRSGTGWRLFWSAQNWGWIGEAGIFMTGPAAARATFSEVRFIEQNNYPDSIARYLKITEVAGDFYELTNFSGATLDLSKVILGPSGDDYGGPWRFPSGTTLAAGKSLVVVPSVAAFQQTYGSNIQAVALPSGIPGVFSATPQGFYLSEPSTEENSYPRAFTQILYPSTSEFFGAGSAFTVIDPSWNLAQRTNWKAQAPSPGTYIQPAPRLTLNVSADCWEVATHELIYLDASANYRPGSYPLGPGSWDYSPKAPVAVFNSWPGSGVKHLCFDTPGHYTIGFRPSSADPLGEGAQFHLTRELSVASPRDIERFTTPLLPHWRAHRFIERDNWEDDMFHYTYSLVRSPGRLFMETSQRSVLSRAENPWGGSAPLLLRPMGGSNSSLQANIKLNTVGPHLAGLFASSQGSQGDQYVFGFQASTLRILRSVVGVSGGAFTEVYQEPISTGTLRIRASQAGLAFQIRERLQTFEGGDHWRTVWQDSNVTTLTDGGMVINSSSDNWDSATFDDFVVVDPGPASRVPLDLQVTEFSRDFFELTNMGGGELLLDGVFIESNGQNFTLPPNTRLQAGNSLILTASATQFRQQYGIFGQILEVPPSMFVGLFRMAEGAGSPWFRSVEMLYIIEDANSPTFELQDHFANYLQWWPSLPTPGRYFQDFDGDQLADAAERKFGSNSGDPLSRYAMTTGKNDSGQALLSWNSTYDQLYQVEYCTTLGGPWLLLANLVGTGSSLSFTDSTTPVPSSRFYRVVAP